MDDNEQAGAVVPPKPTGVAQSVVAAMNIQAMLEEFMKTAPEPGKIEEGVKVRIADGDDAIDFEVCPKCGGRRYGYGRPEENKN